MISIKAFKKTYRDTEIQIDNEEINENIVLLIGKNGSGKSTLLKAIANLIDYQGTILNPYPSLYISEDAEFPEEITVFKYLSLMAKIANLKNMDKASTLITRFSMDEHLNKPLKSLSKGMRQKVHLIQSFMMPYALYLIDEPTNGLDETSIKELKNYLIQAPAKYICATHDASFLEGLPARRIDL